MALAAQLSPPGAERMNLVIGILAVPGVLANTRQASRWVSTRQAESLRHEFGGSSEDNRNSLRADRAGIDARRDLFGASGKAFWNVYKYNLNNL